jgi:hypothetical protein
MSDFPFRHKSTQGGKAQRTRKVGGNVNGKEAGAATES